MRATRFTLSIGALFLCLNVYFSSSAAAFDPQEYLIDGHYFGLFPSPPTVANPLIITSYAGVCGGITFNAAEVDERNRTVRVSFTEYSNDISPCAFPAALVSFPVTGIGEPGTYQIDFYLQRSSSSNENFDAANYADSLEVSIASSTAVYQPETPTQGSTQSGVGTIRGWVCDAQTVAVRFDDLDPIEVAYGTSRADTTELCGDDNNGYGMVFAWGLLGQGIHRMKTFIDGVEVSDVEFEVAGLGEAFSKGLEGAYELKGFPAAGKSVTIEWSEAAQNFVIVASGE